MADYQRPEGFDFICGGMSLRPVDQLPPGKYPYLQNVRVTDQGRIDSRPGNINLNATAFDQPNIHSVRRLNDSTPGATPFARIVGAGTKLYTDASSTAIDTGYSGNPLSMVPWRPDQSVSPRMYVADVNKMVKVKTDGTVKPWGLPQPMAPTPAVYAASGPNAPGRTTLELIVEHTNAPSGAWAVSGTAGALSNVARQTPAQMVGTQPHPHAQSTPGGPGLWSTALITGSVVSGGQVVSILLTSGGGGYFAGAAVNITGGGGTGATASCTFSGGVITSITLTNGGSGYTSPPAVNILGYGTGAFATAFISSGGGTTGIPSYSQGYPGIQPGSLLWVTQGASSPGTNFLDITVEQVIQGAPDTTITGAVYEAGSTGYCVIALASLQAQQAGNSSDFANPEDSLRIDAIAPGSLVLLNFGQSNQEYALIDSVMNGPLGTASIRLITVNTHAAGETISFVPTIVFSANGFAFPPPSGPNAYVQAYAARSTVAAGQGLISSQYGAALTPQTPNAYGWKTEDYVNITLRVDNPANLVDITFFMDIDVTGQNDFAHNALYYTLVSNALIDPTVEGLNQWQTYRFRIADMLRIGTDDAASPQIVWGIRLEVNTIGPVVVDWDSVCMIGGGAVDVGTAVNDYYYRYRYRNLDGSYSNWSPASRYGLHLVRSAAIISVPFTALYDKADVARWGGALTAWTYVGTTDNSLSWNLTDNFSDEAIAASPQAELDDFQPFPDIDVPHSGTCSVTGVKVAWISGQQFSTAWAPGSEILIANKLYHLRVSPLSAVQLEIIENADYQTAVPFLLAQPTLLAQTLPCVFGPDDQGVMFGLGSKYQPGVLFPTKGNAPDNSSDRDQIEVSSASDPLIGGVLNAGRAIVCSASRWWALYPALQGPSRYGPPVELQVGKPLFCRTAICSDGQTIAFLSDDGIYLTTGAQAQSITDPDLRDLFPHDGSFLGVPVTLGGGVTVEPPAMNNSANWMRLSFCDRLLFFDYRGVDGGLYTLVFDMRIGGWVSFDTTIDTTIDGARLHYLEEGSALTSLLVASNDGFLRQFAGMNFDEDQGTTYPIHCKVQTGCFNAGDFRADKKWGDFVVDYDATSAATGITVTPYFESYSTPGTPIVLPPGGRTISAPIDLGQSETRNLGMIYSWAEKVLIRLYAWQPSYIPQPIDMGVTPTDWDDDGYLGAKFLQGALIEGDTENTLMNFQVEGDGGFIGTTFTATFNGQSVQAFSWPPFITHTMRLAPNSPNATWKKYKIQWIWEPEPELTPYWMTQGTDHDLQGFMHVKEVQIAHMSTYDIQFYIKADLRQYELIIPNSGGAYQKTYLILPPNKAKLYTYSLISPPGFRLFKRDCEVKVKQWGSTGPYLPFNPFGGEHRRDGARI